jgi:hypothetical protein
MRLTTTPALCYGGEATRGTSGLGLGHDVQQLPSGSTFASDADDADAMDVRCSAAAVRGALGRDLDALLLAAAQLGMRVELAVYSVGGGTDGGNAAGGAAEG